MQELHQHISIDGLIHQNGHLIDPSDMHEVIPEEMNDVLLKDHPISAARDDSWYESSYNEDVAESHARAAARAQKENGSNVKKELINKFDGLIHAANGDLLDPSDHHIVKITENE